jgi:hypothetical protein
MALGATACRPCWRKGKGSHGTGGRSILAIMRLAVAMNPAIGETVNIEGFNVTRTKDGYQLG